MKKRYISLLLMASLLVLSACNKDDASNEDQFSVDDGETTNSYGSINHGVDEGKVGFNMMGGKIEAAADVPAEEKEAILKVFTLYMDAFNEKDIDTYLGTLSDKSKSFDKATEKVELEKNFKQFDVKREASEVVIVKYTPEEAHVYSNMATTLKQLNSGLEKNDSGKQVTVLTKEDGEWKVSSIHYLGDAK